MPAVAAGAAIAGAGMSAYGSIVSANDQSQLDQARADIARQQADEIASRESANEAIRNQAATRQKLQFGASYAASGKAGVGIGSQLQIQNQADLASMISNREAMFQEKMLRQQSGIDTTLAEQALSSGTLNAIAAGLGGAARAASIETAGGNNPGYGGTQSMGPYPQPGSNGGSAGNYSAPRVGAGAYGGG